jgi:transposase
MRPATAALTLADGQREVLESLAKLGTAPHRQVIRAKALLLASEGLANTAIAARLEISPSSVVAWRARFAEEGLAELGKVRPGRGRKPSLSAETVTEIVHATLHDKPQALDRTQPTLPMKKGRAGTMTHDYKRNGTTTLFAALNVLTGKVIGECLPNTATPSSCASSAVLIERSQGPAIHLILDNYGTHKYPNVTAWLDRHPRFHLHFTPTSSSWLNLVERWFRNLTDKAIRRGVFHSVPDLITAIEAYLEANNDDPKPFVWTATAEEILEKVRRGRVTLERIAG